jgi:hypothetical protein
LENGDVARGVVFEARAERNTKTDVREFTKCGNAVTVLTALHLDILGSRRHLVKHSNDVPVDGYWCGGVSRFAGTSLIFDAAVVVL